MILKVFFAMMLAKGKIIYPLLIKSTCTIYNVNFIIKSYNNITNPIVFFDLISCLEKRAMEQCRSFPGPKVSKITINISDPINM